jgi:hypothetical protein
MLVGAVRIVIEQLAIAVGPAIHAMFVALRRRRQFFTLFALGTAVIAPAILKTFR